MLVGLPCPIVVNCIELFYVMFGRLVPGLFKKNKMLTLTPVRGVKKMTDKL